MVGTLIGTYRLEEKLGDGGLGGVFRAIDSASGKEAAFRVFTREVSGDAMLADRLRAMAPALKKLQHPNIAAFYELVNVGPDLALFLEFVPGATLDKVRQPAGRLETSVAVSCAVQILRAFEFAHAMGVLHHALRPTNVMVTRQGTVKVLDFGIGHAFGANRKTREDRLVSVLSYLAPEQIQNQPGDARADIYSVGVLLYELLTGRRPFDHKTEFAILQAHISEPPAAPRAIAPDLPEWLDQAVLRALAKNPASRYQNATEFRAVLEAALGLSTSREAAIVRQRSGATAVETFAAAPPIPRSMTPPPGALAGHGAPTAAHVPVGEPPAAGDAAETVMSGSPIGAEAAAAATARTGVPAEAAAAAVPAAMTGKPARARRSGALVAVALAALGLAAAGVYFWTRGSDTPGVAVAPAPAAEAPPPANAEAAPAVTEPGTAPPETATLSPQAASAQASMPPAPAAGAGAAPTPAAAKAAPKPQQKPSTSSTPAPPRPASPPVAAAPALPKAPDVSYRKVKLVTQAGSSEKTTDVVLLLSEDRVSVTPADGGAALRAVRYADITAASYSKAQKKRLGFIKSAQHLLELDTAGEPLLLRLDKDNVDAILAAIEARSGKAVAR